MLLPLQFECAAGLRWALDSDINKQLVGNILASQLAACITVTFKTCPRNAAVLYLRS
jgi:hypothetical protein